MSSLKPLTRAESPLSSSAFLWLPTALHFKTHLFSLPQFMFRQSLVYHRSISNISCSQGQSQASDPHQHRSAEMAGRSHHALFTKRL